MRQFPNPNPQFLAQTKREFAFLSTLEFVVQEEHEGTYASFKDGFHIVYHSPEVLELEDYLNGERQPSTPQRRPIIRNIETL